MMKSFFPFLACFLSLTIFSSREMLAQEIKVKSCTIVQSDNTATENARYDINNDMCALIKVVTNDIEGLVFNNTNQYVGDIACDKGIYYVYVSPGMYMLSFSHPDFQPGTINLANFGYKKKTIGGKTYQVELEAQKPLNNMKSVAFKVSPVVDNSFVIFEGNKKAVEGSGLVEFFCKEGTYGYRIQAENYETVFGKVTISDKNIEPISIALQPLREPVKISCNVPDAEVVVDNINYGVVGIKQIPRGKHNIRITANGYFDINDNIDVTGNSLSLDYKMRKNKNRVVNIHAVDVQIFCESKYLYRNNMKLPGWENGKTIKMMPYTECKLSDDKGKSALLKVGDKSISIKLADGKITYLNKQNISN